VKPSVTLLKSNPKGTSIGMAREATRLYDIIKMVRQAVRVTRTQGLLENNGIQPRDG
jgi:hypothetical protein